MAGAGGAGEKSVMDVVREKEGDDVKMFGPPVDPPGPTPDEIAHLDEWAKNLFTPPSGQRM